MKKIFIFGFLMSTACFTLSAQIEVATFENLNLPDNSYWCGELDDDDEDMGYSMSSFNSGSFEFNNFYWPDYYTWSFFAYSTRTEKTFSSYVNDQFNSITGSGADNSRTFGVVFPAAYMGKTIMTVGDEETPALIPGMQIVNTAWVVDCILNGDGYEGPFKTGDWFTLVLTGFVDDKATSSKTIYLADYRSENTAEHYFLDTWTWVDLTDLGEVTSVQFDIQSSKTNAYGATTPTYVCIDNVGITEDKASVTTPVTPMLTLNYIPGSRHLVISGINNSAQYFVTDTLGKTLLSGHLDQPNANVDMSSLGAGIYIVFVSDGTSRRSMKVVL